MRGLVKEQSICRIAISGEEYPYLARAKCALAFRVACATIVEEVCKLVDAGFEYLCEIGEARLFRKPK